MNKNFIFVGLLSGLVLIGCQNIEEQFAEKLTEGIINSSTGGEVDLDIKDLESGKMTIKTEDGEISINAGAEDGSASFKVTDETGKTVTATAGQSETRPAGAPDDFPSLPGALAFDLVNVGEMDTLSYNIVGSDAKAACEKQSTLVESVGWDVDPDFFVFESEESVLKSYLKDGKKMVLSCNLEADSVNIVMSSNAI